MWPMLLNMTRDECRLTLRRLELEAYSNMVNVFRAQGALEDNRKKLLEELRAVLHITQDRHSAEARRVSNDQLLATIAEQLSGPNTGLGWISEGRRRIPLLPRGIPQTAYTEIADKAAEAAAAENREIQKRLEEKLIAPKTNEEEMSNGEGQTAEGNLSSNETMDESLYPPVAMEDQTTKLWDTELITRKRKVPEGGALPDDAATPVKNMRNIPVNTNQKHLNLSQVYSKFSQPASSKPPGQSKHSYNQVSKVSTSKSNQPHAPRSTPHKHRAHKAQKNSQTKAQARKSQEMPVSPNKQYNPTSLPMQLEYAGPPNTFQASYAQSVLGSKTKPEFADEMKPKVVSPSRAGEAGAAPATVPHELEFSENAQPEDAAATPVRQSISGKPSHLILKNRGDITDKKGSPGDVKIVQKPSEGIKLLSNRQVVVATSSAQKVVSAPSQKVLSTPGKLVTTKVIGSIPKGRPASTPGSTEKMIVVSKPSTDNKNLSSSRLIVTSSVSTVAKERTPVSASNVARLTESLTPKGIPATDLKVSAKAVVLNPKSGQKMVVVPAKGRTKSGNESQIPLIHFKGITTAMKLVPVSSQPMPQVAKSSSVTVLSKPSTVSSQSVPSTAKIIGMEPIKTANLADIVPVKGLAPVTTPKITNPIVRPSSAKGNVIVVQKGTPIAKALTFAKNGNDMSKIIMGKNVTQLLQASKSDHAEAGKSSGNVIVLELNNEQSGRPTTMSEILDSRGTTARVSGEKKPSQITTDTPVLFDSQLTEETCNTSSLDSTVESIGGIVPMEDAGLSLIEKDEEKSHFRKDSEGAKDSSSVTDWEMELDTVSRKDKDDDDKLNSLHLDLGMSSDSDGEYMGTGRKSKSKHSAQARERTATGGESGGMFGSSGGMSLATRTLLSQLQDDGSSSNDSSFALKAKGQERAKRPESKLDRVESDELTKAKEKLSEKVAEATSQRRRIDVYSTAIGSADINLDSFAYLEESLMAGDDVFEEGKARDARRLRALDDPLSRLLADDCASTDSQPLNK